jgi:hypothetical protein
VKDKRGDKKQRQMEESNENGIRDERTKEKM